MPKKEPSVISQNAKRPAPDMLQSLLLMARHGGWAIIPAVAAPYPLNTYVKPGNLADCIIIVDQNNNQAVDDAEALAQSLCGDGGHFTTHTYGGDLQRMSYPILTTYLDK